MQRRMNLNHRCSAIQARAKSPQADAASRKLCRIDFQFKSRKEACSTPLKTYTGLNDFSDQSGPSGLMGSANSSTIIAVEILVKVNVVAKMGIVL
jgi:hypothetical protein